MVSYSDRVDEVFRALADPTRRQLLDELFRQDGQPLNALAARFDMSRIGVAKHLAVLEGAGLVVSRRSGREKRHFINAIPIREVHDRWVSKYTAGVAAGLLALKHDLEHDMEKVYELFIRTTPERLWQAITDPDERTRYHFGNAIESEWTGGSAYAVTNPHAPGPLIQGENLEVDPPRRLVQTMRAMWGSDELAAITSRVTWEIEQVEDSCRLVVTHDQLPADASAELYGGWPMILSGLKTWLETGDQLTTPGSLMYG